MMQSSDVPSDLCSHAEASSAEQEYDEGVWRTNQSTSQTIHNNHTPFQQFKRSAMKTPSTVKMTPSPARSSVSNNPGTAPTRAPNPGFVEVQQGYLDGNSPEPVTPAVALFRDATPSRSRPKTRSSSGSRRSDANMQYEETPPWTGMGRRKSSFHGRTPSQSSHGGYHSSAEATPESSPDASPNRRTSYPRTVSTGLTLDNLAAKTKRCNMGKCLIWSLLGLIVSTIAFSISMTSATYSVEEAYKYEPTRPSQLHMLSEAGLRGKMTTGHWADVPHKKDKKKKEKKKEGHHVEKKEKKEKIDASSSQAVHVHTSNVHEPGHYVKQPTSVAARHLSIHKPAPNVLAAPHHSFPKQDPNMYSRHGLNQRRVVNLDSSSISLPSHPRKIKVFPADVTDSTQLYGVLDSSDERLNRMEVREPYSVGECVPMQDWQTTYHPFCNGMHELAVENLGDDQSNDFNLFGTKGYWRHAWRVDVKNDHAPDTVVLKTLKFEHNFEDAHFEHDRVDAVAMERLTSSRHVINVFGFCGHSVLSEFADGSRLGELADKARKKPLERLRIASDIAHGLADVHSIDGEGNSTFVHLDINPANVVSVGGTLKLNDFNIGIIRRWNTTSHKPCGFPAQYPNPQWRSPEEARNEQDLTEKVDVFSMGHIFFRLICGHEPWNKLEPDGKPSKEDINNKVQHGIMPTFPEEVINSTDPEVVAIRDAMVKCYSPDPTQRPGARQIAIQFDAVLKQLSQAGSIRG